MSPVEEYSPTTKGGWRVNYSEETTTRNHRPCMWWELGCWTRTRGRATPWSWVILVQRGPRCCRIDELATPFPRGWLLIGAILSGVVFPSLGSQDSTLGRFLAQMDVLIREHFKKCRVLFEFCKNTVIFTYEGLNGKVLEKRTELWSRGSSRLVQLSHHRFSQPSAKPGKGIFLRLRFPVPYLSFLLQLQSWVT